MTRQPEPGRAAEKGEAPREGASDAEEQRAFAKGREAQAPLFISLHG